MTLVKATRAFYHDAVGTRAHNELFEIKNQTVLSELENAGFVQKADGQMAEARTKMEQEQKQVGQVGAQTNEKVSLAHHEQNMQANAHQQQIRQSKVQPVQIEDNVETDVTAEPKAKNKKADK